MTVAKVYDIKIKDNLRKIQMFTNFSEMKYRGVMPSKYATMGMAASYGTGRRLNEERNNTAR